MKYNITSLYNDATAIFLLLTEELLCFLFLLVILCSTDCAVADCRASSVYRLLLLRLPAAELALADCVTLKCAHATKKRANTNFNRLQNVWNAILSNFLILSLLENRDYVLCTRLCVSLQRDSREI